MFSAVTTKNSDYPERWGIGLEPPPVFPLPISALPESPVKIPIPEIDAIKPGMFDESGLLAFRSPGYEDTTQTYETDQQDNPSQKSGYEIADIFRLYGKQYRENHRLTIQQQKVMDAIVNCRTGRLGFHVNICESCGSVEIFTNSCRNGHCPKCQSNKRFAWVEARINDMLPVPYYHVVFTLPDGIYPMCLYNQKVIYDILFQSSVEALKKFGADPRWLGADIGFFGILHTWGQLLNVHLHIHFIVPAGGIDKQGNWVEPKYEKNNFLFPVHAVSEVYRGIFIEKLKNAFKERKLEFSGELEYLENEYDFENWINKLVSKKWVVYAKKPFDGPEQVIAYIGRYTHRVAISNSRILSIDNGVIRFSYKNYKKLKKVKEYKEIWEETELSAEEFIRRFLHHVLPERYHRIRHYGFLSNGCKKKYRKLREQLFQETDSGLPEKEETIKGRLCPICKKGEMKLLLLFDRNGKLLKGSDLDLIKFEQLMETNFRPDQRPCIQDTS